MQTRSVTAWGALFAFGLLFGACDGESGDANKPNGAYGAYGASCASDADCESGLCHDAFCTIECDETTDCDQGYGRSCGMVRGVRVCVPGCSHDEYGCVDGVSTWCEDLDETHCESCGCPEALRCEPGVGCVAKSDEGGNCLKDSDCLTENCSLFAGICRAAVGAPCTVENCDQCLAAEGWSYCSRECLIDNACNVGNTLTSLCRGGGGIYHCAPRCSGAADPNCPGNCRITEDQNGDSIFFCQCTAPKGCSAIEPLRPFGAGCHVDSDCESAKCDAVSAPCTDSPCEPLGMCTTSCASSADCPSGTACADPGDGARCMATCRVSPSRRIPNDGDTCPYLGFRISECAQLTTVEGSDAQLCWVKRSSGPCSKDADCRSGQCLSDFTCQPG